MISTVEVFCKCGQKFTARIADRKRGWGKFCSKTCKALHSKKRAQPKKINSLNNQPAEQIDDYDGSWDSHNY